MALAGSARAEIIESYMVRDWVIGAYTDDDTKEFSHCAMRASYKNGVILVFIINRDRRWFMNLANEVWNLTEGRKYSFDIDLDGRTGESWVGVAISQNVLSVPLANQASLFELFSAAHLLTIRAANGTYRFDLANSRVGLEAVAACTARYLEANPFAGAPKGPKSRARGEKHDSEGALVKASMDGGAARR
jgi:hypothetical protein